MIQSLNGLAYIHNNHTIHRDIKPSNILVTCDGVSVLGDLGLAKILSDNNSTQDICGTPSYMAPEVFARKSYDEKVDIWSLGATIYELCTLEPAYKGSWTDLPHIMKNKPIESIPDLYSNGLKTMILHMLTHNSEDRPNASELLNHEYIQNYIQNSIIL